MGKNSGIAWTDHTFSPWWGCVEVSPACDACYAREWDARFSGISKAGVDQGDPHWGKEAPRRFFGDKHWNEPLAWNRKAAALGKRHLVFCASMADVFETGRPDLEPHRQRLWDLIGKTPALTWLLLTKRPQNIKRLLPDELVGTPTIWLGTTVESPAYLWRAAEICQNHAPVRFLSMEPLLESVSIKQAITAGVNWIITGCESGPKARSTPTDWYRQLRDDCRAMHTAFFLKQAPRGADGITSGTGSWVKLKGGIIEQPYLDGVQHVEFPVSPA